MEVRFTWFACRASLNKLGKHNCTRYFDVKFAGPELDFRTSELGNICAFLILFPNLNIALFCYLFNPLVLWQSDKWLNLCFLRLQTWRHYSSDFSSSLWTWKPSQRNHTPRNTSRNRQSEQNGAISKKGNYFSKWHFSFSLGHWCCSLSKSLWSRWCVHQRIRVLTRAFLTFISLSHAHLPRTVEMPLFPPSPS